LRAYLAEPHYFRLGYQLAAQYANWLLETEDLDRPDDELPDADDAGRAIEIAEQVAAEARETIDWYEARQQAHRWWNPWSPSALLPKERRLLRFLSGTVEPSAQLVAAGLFVSIVGDIGSGEDRAGPIRTRARDESDLSYRALYNLACYETSRGQPPLDWEHNPFHLALQALGLAFRRTGGRFRAELAHWASSDPALAPLRVAEPVALAELLARYAARRDDSHPQRA
jgi:hypothetical protein